MISEAPFSDSGMLGGRRKWTNETAPASIRFMTEPIQLPDGGFFDHKPNRWHKVRILRESDMPGFIVAVDVNTRQRLVFHKSVLPADAVVPMAGTSQ